jgi:hypothetical protein
VADTAARRATRPCRRSGRRIREGRDRSGRLLLKEKQEHSRAEIEGTSSATLCHKFGIYMSREASLCKTLAQVRFWWSSTTQTYASGCSLRESGGSINDYN